jgi:hypothetical protein
MICILRVVVRVREVAMKRKALVACYSFILLLGFFGVAYGSAPSAVAGGDSRGFIATAALGSYLDPHVVVWRNFADRFLLTNRPGGVCVSLYHRASPPVAEFIAKREGLKMIVRTALLPLIGFAALALKLGLLWTFLIVMGIPATAAIFLIWLRSTGQKDRSYSEPYMPKKISSLIQAGRLQ